MLSIMPNFAVEVLLVFHSVTILLFFLKQMLKLFFYVCLAMKPHRVLLMSSFLLKRIGKSSFLLCHELQNSAKSVSWSGPGFPAINSLNHNSAAA